MSAQQMTLFSEPAKPAERRGPHLIFDVGLAYVCVGWLDWHDVVDISASGPPQGCRERIYRLAKAVHRRRRVGIDALAEGAGVPEPAAAAFVKGMWFRWSASPKWRPVLTDDNLARIAVWLGLPEPQASVEIG